MKNRGVGAAKVAAAYIGTIVGAGFATGQEVLQYFLKFGNRGVIGIALTTLLFVIFGSIIMQLGRTLGAKSHLEVIRHSGGRFAGRIIDFIITFFLFGALTAMLAGTGALFSQIFKIPAVYGAIFMAVITAATVLTGINGVINSISYVVPFLLTSVVGISLYSIFTVPPNFSPVVLTDGSPLVSNWFVSAVLYTSYNTIISVAVLAPLGVKAKSESAIKAGAILGGVGLGLGAIMIFLAMSGYSTEISMLEVPMTFIAGRISPFVQIIYTIILIAEVYTTAVSSLYGFCARISGEDAATAKYKFLLAGATMGAFFASLLGFSNLVKYLYSIVGYAGLVLLVSLVYIKIIKKRLGA